jgi:hypothetical protein
MYSTCIGLERGPQQRARFNCPSRNLHERCEMEPYTRLASLYQSSPPGLSCGKRGSKEDALCLYKALHDPVCKVVA